MPISSINAGNGWFAIKNVRSGMVLEVAGGSTADNASIQQNIRNGSASQRSGWGGLAGMAEDGRWKTEGGTLNTEGENENDVEQG